MKNLFRKSLLAVVVPAVLLFSAACADDELNGPAVDMGQGSQIRIVHASPDAPPTRLRLLRPVP
jgi:hypothetical protein